MLAGGGGDIHVGSHSLTIPHRQAVYYVHLGVGEEYLRPLAMIVLTKSSSVLGRQNVADKEQMFDRNRSSRRRTPKSFRRGPTSS
jgi:hypothetical protein